MRIKLGLKAWSTNLSLISAARGLYDAGKLDYVEVFCIPGSVEGTAGAWAAANLPAVVHAPHSAAGLNFAKAELRERNRELAQESYRLADALGAELVIFHPGMDGPLAETLSQMRSLKDPRMVIENKPFRGLNGGTCVGSTPEEIETALTELSIGFCLDFGHAIASANSHKEDPLDYACRFLAFGPRLYHLTDGDYASELDSHEPYGKGSFPLRALLALIPDGARVTDEAKRRNNDSAGEYLQDRTWLEQFIAQDGDL